MNRHLRFIAGREPSSDSTEGEEAGTRGRKNASQKSKQKTKKKSKLNVTKNLMKEMNYHLCFYLQVVNRAATRRKEKRLKIEAGKMPPNLRPKREVSLMLLNT